MKRAANTRLYESRRVTPWSVQPECDAIKYAWILEVKVYRLPDSTWRFIGGPGRIDITTATPAALTWQDLGLT